MSEYTVRVYRYGLLPPTAEAERVGEQIWRAHRYHHALVEIEQRRRTAVADAMASLHAGMASAVAAVEAATASLEALRAAAKAAKSAAADGSGGVPRAALAEARATLAAARAGLKEARAAAREDATVQAALAAIAAEDKAARLAARASCGVYWGTYLLVEQAMDAARRSVTPPRFQRWTGEGAVGVQIQGGMLAHEATAATDTRLQIDLRPQPVPGRGGKARPRVRLRVGSAGREPIWAEWPLIYHRPLPEDGRIMGAKVLRQRVGGKDVWSLHVTLRLPVPVRADDAPRGMVAVDLGWRREAGALVAAVVQDDRGQSETWTLPTRVVGALDKADDIRSIRDRLMNDLRDVVQAWRGAQDALPEAQREALGHLHAWRSPSRFARLARWWREHRCAGDADVYEALQTWYGRDRHLWLYEVHSRRGALAHRRDTYRAWASRLAQQYDTLVVERLDLRRVSNRTPEPDEPREASVAPAPRQRVVTAPSELRTALVQAFAARGGQVVQVPAGPAATLLQAARERSGDDATPAPARESRSARFARIKREQAAAKAMAAV